MERQLAAILYADVAGYRRLTGLNEEATHERLDAGLNFLTEVISEQSGKKVHEAGDAILAAFQSVSGAVNAAAEFQTHMADRNSEVADDHRLEFRIGVTVGEVIHDRDDVHGNDVNIAARIQERAEPGGVCVSGAAYEQVQGKVAYAFDDLGHHKLKNIPRCIRVYALRLTERSSRSATGMFIDTLANRQPVTTGGCL